MSLVTVRSKYTTNNIAPAAQGQPGSQKQLDGIFQPILTIKARADGETPGVRDVRYYYGSHPCINDGNRAGKIFRIHHYFFPIKLIFID